MKISYRPSNGQYRLLIKKEYDSWLSSNFTPTGTFKFEFPMSEFLIPIEGKTLHPTETKTVISIECHMKNNKFTNLQITDHMDSKSLGITKKDIYENIRTSSIMVFDYDLTKILPVPMWDKLIVKDFIASSLNDNFTKHLNNILLAAEYIQYCSYAMTEPYAVWLIAQPSFFRKPQSTSTENSDPHEILNPVAAEKIVNMINSIDKSLFVHSPKGLKGGDLTNKAETILFEYLNMYDYKKEDLEDILITRMSGK